jgi:hypothetical protein
VEKPISEESVIVASKDQVSCDLAGEAAILDLKSGTYYGLDQVGATVWGMLSEPRRVIEVRNALLEQYEVEAEQCGRELIHLLGELRSSGLIQVVGEDTASDAAE